MIVFFLTIVLSVAIVASVTGVIILLDRAYKNFEEDL